MALADDVKVILGTDADVSKHVAAAQRLIASISCLSANYSADVITDLTLYVACHLSALAVRQNVSEERLGDAQIKYTIIQGATGLASTPYGQVALSLDSYGCLQAIGRKKALVFAVGPVSA